MLTRALKMTFWIAYDHMGKLIVVNFLCAVVLAFPLYLTGAAILTLDAHGLFRVAAPLLVLVLGGLLPVLGAGIAHMLKEVIDTRDGAVATFFAGVRRFWRRALRLGLAYSAAFGCLAASVWFYPVRLGQRWPLVGYSLGAIAVWVLVLLLLSAMYALPALVQRQAGVFATMKLSLLLVIDNPLATLGIAAHLAMVATFALVPPVFFFIAISLPLVLVSSMYELFARKYAAQDAHRGPGRLPVRAIDFGDSQDDYLNRGFRDFLFPWKG